ncbi:MAG: glycosyltransferase family 2 protein, partial [Candidatus Omnitrophica bacterium]|nr:glycosyltransferase family 2 protein [Candidatus Omnitrophota bacterium]
STDGTLEACRAAGARVVTETGRDNFAHLRNVGAEAASGDWVLQLDADEVVTPEFRQALQEILSDSGSHAAYKFRRRNNFLGHWMRFGGWDHDSLHLFRKGLARYEGRVHERLRVDGPIGLLKVGVEHYPFRSLEEFIDRQNRYTSLQARDLLEERGPVSMRTLWFQTTVKPFKLFWKIFVKKQGFREGMPGLLFAGLYAYVHLLKWAKLWELLDLREGSK